MKKIKLFLDIDKEIEWLNEVSKEGFRLVKKKGAIYYFENCKKEEYLYQVEKTKLMNSKTYNEHIDLLEDMGINVIKNQFGWIYYERKNDGSEFELYTDSKSKIEHYTIIIKTLLIITFVSLCIMKNVLNNPIGSQGPYLLNVSVPIVGNLLISFTMIIAMIKYILKIKQLQK